jgi:hypothetical protein
MYIYTLLYEPLIVPTSKLTAFGLFSNNVLLPSTGPKESDTLSSLLMDMWPLAKINAT